MTTTDDTALQEQIARALDPYAWERRDRWSSGDHPNYSLLDNIVIVSTQQAAAVLPIIRAEVTKAQAQALRDAADDAQRRANARELLELAIRYGGYYQGIVTASREEAKDLRARADQIEKEQNNGR